MCLEYNFFYIVIVIAGQAASEDKAKSDKENRSRQRKK